MEQARIHYFRCPYCKTPGGHCKKVGKTVGLFRIKALYDNVLLLECQKCSKVCRVKKVGATLRWEDMSSTERKVHQQKAWVSYNKHLEEENEG